LLSLEGCTYNLPSKLSPSFFILALGEGGSTCTQCTPWLRLCASPCLFKTPKIG